MFVIASLAGGRTIHESVRPARLSPTCRQPMSCVSEAVAAIVAAPQGLSDETSTLNVAMMLPLTGMVRVLGS